MSESLDSGHILTDEDVDTARLIMDLDQALGRSTDPLTRRVAATPIERVRPLLAAEEPPSSPAPTATAILPVNGSDLPAAEHLIRTLTSPEQAAELAREVGRRLPEDMEPGEQARLVHEIEALIHQRLQDLVTEAGGGTAASH